MYALPIVIPPEDDELLGSWMYRLSKANLFDNPDAFIRSFVRAQAGGGYKYIKYDDTEEFAAFYLALQSSTPMADLYLQTSCYAGLAPFLASGQQSKRLNLSFRRTYGKPEFTPKVTPLTRDLRLCERCRSEELEDKGFWYYHRAHQLPGVKVCKKHACMLMVYNGKQGHEFDDDAPFEMEEANASGDIMLRYAAFCKDILRSAPDTDLSGTKQVIKEALRRLGYGDRGTDYATLKSDIERREMTQMFPVDMEHYMKIGLASPYPSIEQTMALVFFLFDSAQDFVQRLPQPDAARFWERIGEGGYELVGSFRSNLIQLRHECGTEFCTTADGFASGWSCPRCDAERTNQEIFDDLIAHAGDNKYSTRGKFRGFDSEVSLRHHECGRETAITPRAFLFEGTRCTCRRQQKKEALLQKVNIVGGFELVTYNSHNEHLTIKHLGCGNAFDCNYDHFMADMRCPHCESGVKAGLRPPIDAAVLRRRMADIVGDEYTLETTEIQDDTPVAIRHNKCGRSQEYSRGKFLMGRRCSHCRTPITMEAKYELIPYLSNGEYVVLSIADDRMCRLRNLVDGSEYDMDFDYVVQELTRPTKSPILPCREPNRDLQGFVPTTAGYFERLLAHLRATYKKDDVLFMEDFETFGADHLQMKRVAKKLVDRNIVERIYPGIYKWTGSNLSANEVVNQRYICRRKNRIGYLSGHSFAYEIGLVKQAPDRIHITTNLEAGLHGRNRSFLGVQLYLRGSKATVTDENWMILQLLDLLPNLSKYTDWEPKQTETILRNYIRSNGLAYDQAEPYLGLYANWVGPQLEKLCEEDK